MQTISLKSNSPDTIIPLLINAINREKRILVESIRVAKERVTGISKSLGIDIEKLMEGMIEHNESNEMQLIELEGEIDILRHQEAELKELDSIEICK